MGTQQDSIEKREENMSNLYYIIGLTNGEKIYCMELTEQGSRTIMTGIMTEDLVVLSDVRNISVFHKNIFTTTTLVYE